MGRCFHWISCFEIRAAQKLKIYFKQGLHGNDVIDFDDLLKRVLYPKIKGQRGGGFVWSDVERTQIDVLAGTIKPKRSKPMKKLKQFTKLFNLRQRKNSNNKTKPFNKSIEYISALAFWAALVSLPARCLRVVS